MQRMQAHATVKRVMVGLTVVLLFGVFSVGPWTGPAVTQAQDAEGTIQQTLEKLGIESFRLLNLDRARLTDQVRGGQTVLPIALPGGQVTEAEARVELRRIRSSEVRAIQKQGEGDARRVQLGPPTTFQGSIVGDEEVNVLISASRDLFNAAVFGIEGQGAFVQDLRDLLRGSMAVDPAEVRDLLEESQFTHVAYNLADVRFQLDLEGDTLRPEQQASAAPRGQPIVPTMRLASHSSATIDVTADGDSEFARVYGSNWQQKQEQVLHWTEYILNVGEPFFHGNYDISFNVVSYESWSSGGPGSTNAGTLLNQFKNAFHTDPGEGFTYAFSGKRIQGGTIGIAWVGGLRFPHGQRDFAHGLGQMVGFVSGIYRQYMLASHEIGHILGANHRSERVCWGSWCGPEIMRSFLSNNQAPLHGPETDGEIRNIVHSWPY